MCQNNFSLLSGSFDKGSNDKDTIYNNIVKLFDVNEKIKLLDDLVFKEEDIFTINVIDDKQLYEIMYLDHAVFNQDYKTMLIEIVNKAKNSDGEDYQKVGLNHVAIGGVIYTKEDLMQYYYKCMEETNNEEEFAVCIKKYFKNLKFQNSISDTLSTLDGGGLEYFSKDIIKSLICLENEFREMYEENNRVLPKSLKKLESTIGLETTMEGNIKRKPDFTFEFKKDDKSKVQMCCEPHIKLSASSKSGDNTFYFNRLHFHVGEEGIETGKILVGSIGCHL